MTPEFNVDPESTELATAIAIWHYRTMVAAVGRDGIAEMLRKGPSSLLAKMDEVAYRSVTVRNLCLL